MSRIGRTVTAMGLVACLAGVAIGQTVTKVVLTPASLTGGATATGKVTLSKAAGTNGAVVSLKSSSTAASVAASVTVMSGASSATFTVNTVPVAANVTASIKASLGTSSSSGTLAVKAPTLSSVTCSPATLTGGGSSSGTVTIGSAAPSAGLKITLTSGSTSASVPASVTIAGGATSATFAVTTKPVTAATTAKITAKLGTSSIGVSLTINPLALVGLSVNPSSVSGGVAATGTVSLGGPAPSSGLSIGLSSSSSSAVVPSTVTVAGGASSATFSITTKAVTAKTTATITAKFGSKSVTASLTLTAGTTFAGSYTGSYYQTGNGGGLGTVTVAINAAGALTGSATDYTGSSPSTVSLSGTVASNGTTSVTSKSNQGSSTVSGEFKFGPVGNLIGALEGSSSGATYYITVVLTSTGKPVQFVGNYTGSSTDSSNSVSGVSSFNVSSTGSWTATGANGTTASGTVNASGISTFTKHGQDGTKTGTIYFAFDVNGLLNGLIVDSTGNRSVLTLTKSYAGIYQVSSSGGGTATLVVDDSGVALGSSGPGQGPAVLSGTVSATGVVNLTGTPVGSYQGGPVTVTGNVSTVVGGFSGSGTYSGSVGNSGTWTVSGVPEVGMFYSGSYTLKTSGGLSLTLTIAASGTITVSGAASSGATYVGCIQADGAVVIIAKPTGNAAGTTIFAGEFVLTGNAYTGSGGYLAIDGTAGTWTVTPN